MICKKCGATISDGSKFCGYCGEKVNDINSTQIPVQDTEQPVVNDSEVNNVSLDQNNQIVQPENQASVEQTNTDTETNASKSPKKGNNNKIVFIVLGVVLAVLAAVLVILAFNKTANSSIATLEKVLNNIGEKGVNSGTINAKISIEDNTTNSVNLSASVKYSKNNDTYNFELKLNESMLFDEMSLFLKVNEDSATFYADSNTIDLLGSTKSDENIWVYYLLDLKDANEDIKFDANEEVDLKDILDEKHFKYIDKTNNLKHYKMIIDKDLLEKLKSKMPDEYSDEFGSEFPLTDSYELDFYINDSDELVRISMDLTDKLGNNEIKSAVISFDFENFGSTNVVIPNEALNSKIDMEKYMETYAVNPSIDDSDLDENNPNLDFDADFDADLDSNLDLDSNSDFNL